MWTSNRVVTIETLTQTDLDQSMVTDVIWLQHAAHTTKKLRLNWLYLIGARSKPFPMSDGTLPRSSSHIQPMVEPEM